MQLSTKIKVLVNELKTEQSKLIIFKVQVYKLAWSVEEAYKEETSNVEFAKVFPTFRKFIGTQINSFDEVDYEKYRALIMIDKSDYLAKISNSGLYTLKRRLIKNGKPHKDAEKVFKLLPKDKTIDLTETLNALNKAGIKGKTKKPGSAPRVRTVPKYSQKELNAMTKNDLIELVKKVQTVARRFETALKKAKAN